jgi:hypothetical protein
MRDVKPSTLLSPGALGILVDFSSDVNRIVPIWSGKRTQYGIGLEKIRILGALYPFIPI